MNPLCDIDENHGVVLSHEAAVQRRLREGLCLTCPNKLFRVKKPSLIRLRGRKIPLTNRRVLSGRCLDCRPLETSSDSSARSMGSVRSDLRERIGGSWKGDSGQLCRQKSDNRVILFYDIHSSMSLQDENSEENSRDDDAVTISSTSSDATSSDTASSDESHLRGQEDQCNDFSVSARGVPLDIQSELENGIRMSRNASLIEETHCIKVDAIPEIDDVQSIISDMFSASSLSTPKDRIKQCKEIISFTNDKKVEFILCGGLVALHKMMISDNFLPSVLVQEQICFTLQDLLPAATDSIIEYIPFQEALTSVARQHAGNSEVIEVLTASLSCHLSQRGFNRNQAKTSLPVAPTKPQDSAEVIIDVYEELQKLVVEMFCVSSEGTGNGNDMSSLDYITMVKKSDEICDQIITIVAHSPPEVAIDMIMSGGIMAFHQVLRSVLRYNSGPFADYGDFNTTQMTMILCQKACHVLERLVVIADDSIIEDVPIIDTIAKVILLTSEIMRKGCDHLSSVEMALRRYCEGIFCNMIKRNEYNQLMISSYGLGDRINTGSSS